MRHGRKWRAYLPARWWWLRSWVRFFIQTNSNHWTGLPEQPSFNWVRGRGPRKAKAADIVQNLMSDDWHMGAATVYWIRFTIPACLIIPGAHSDGSKFQHAQLFQVLIWNMVHNPSMPDYSWYSYKIWFTIPACLLFLGLSFYWIDLERPHFYKKNYPLDVNSANRRTSCCTTTAPTNIYAYKWYSRAIILFLEKLHLIRIQ